ncbi:serine--tRNA ligase [Candidiatus Paracoxiella cheracis]|uniref:serine--tRNA ligase n=1 Tax=Candidiatus Paracoxiella cheracis TaxID=3405120 RepID=UPI003BF5F4F4
MLDPKELRNNIDQIAKQLRRRGFELDINEFNILEEKRKVLQKETQELQTKRNHVSKQIGMAKSKGEDASAMMEEVANLGDELKRNEIELEKLQQQLLNFQLMIPNLPQESVPDGTSEKDNKEIRKWGKTPEFDFKPKDHVELGEHNKLIDFEAAAKLSGSRFVVLRDNLARMQRALAQFMLDLHIEEHGYKEVYVPYLVHERCLFGTGQLPKFREDLFEVKGDWNLMLIPTAEVPMVNLVRDDIIDAIELPIKLVGQTPSFRSEAGSYGKDTRGMIRMHQFQKVELVQVVKPENSARAHEEMTGQAEKVLQLLELPYRVVELCTGDLGFSATKTYDLEVWLPAQNCYREISSCSNCGDFQARRMQARWRPAQNAKPELLHTLNASGLAIGRTLVAIMENYQTADGRIRVPRELKRYMGDAEFV